MTASLAEAPIGHQVCRILSAAINAVDPYSAVKQHLSRSENILAVNDQSFLLDSYDRIFIIGAGKASVPMAAATCEILGKWFTKGAIITKKGHGKFPTPVDRPAQLQVFEAGHPLPDDRGVSGTKKIIDLIKTSQENDLVIFLVSGGGSALLLAPAPGITLTDLQKTTAQMLACGATIQEINCIRKHIDLIKGGQLARIIAPSTSVSLVLSDVIGNPLDTIASGPTVHDVTTYTEAISILEDLNLIENIPTSIISRLKAGADGLIPETPKLGDAIFEKTHNQIIASNIHAAKAAICQANNEGFHTMCLTTYLQGEAKHVGKMIGAIARQAALHNEPLPRPACIVLGGESTVTVVGNGLGGRNQEIALSTVDLLAGLERTIVVTLATDGGDGPTDAAGAVVTNDTQARAKTMGMCASKYLRNNDSYSFFTPLLDLIKTGPTLTNVNDICIIITY